MRISLFLRICLPLLACSVLLGAPSNLQVDTKTRALTATDGGTIIDAKAVTLTLGGFTIYDGAGVKTVVTGSTSGVMFGATGNKIGFLGATPIVRPIGTTDLRQALINLGLYTTGGASPLNLNGGAFTAGVITGTNQTLSGNTTIGGTFGVTGATTLANLTGNGVTTFRSGTNFTLLDSADATKRIQFDLTNIVTGTTRTVNVPNANSTTAQAKVAVANQFLTSMSAQGAFTSAQPSYDNLSGLPVLPDDTEAVSRSFFTGYNALFGEFEVATPAFTDIDGIAVAGQIPSLDAAKITTGTFADARIASAATWNGKLDPTGNGSGLTGFTAAQIPNLDAAKITSGAFDPTRIPALDAAKITTGSFDAARIPSLDFSKIATGTVPKAQLPAVTAYTDAANVFVPLQSFNSIASHSLTTSQLANPTAPSVANVGVPGATTWTYKIVAKLSDGTPSAAGTTGSTATGNATLDASNKNSLTWAAVTDAASYDVYRTVAGLVPTSLGKIATVTTPAYIDAGAAGDASTAPATNVTGNLTLTGPFTGSGPYNHLTSIGTLPFIQVDQPTGDLYPGVAAHLFEMVPDAANPPPAGAYYNLVGRVYAGGAGGHIVGVLGESRSTTGVATNAALYGGNFVGDGGPSHTGAIRGVEIDINSGRVNAPTGYPVRDAQFACGAEIVSGGTYQPHVGLNIHSVGVGGGNKFRYGAKIDSDGYSDVALYLGLPGGVNAPAELAIRHINSRNGIAFQPQAPGLLGGNAFLVLNDAGTGDAAKLTIAGNYYGQTVVASPTLTPASGIIAGDMSAARSSTEGAFYLGTDGTAYLYRNGTAWNVAGGYLSVEGTGTGNNALAQFGDPTVGSGRLSLQFGRSGLTSGSVTIQGIKEGVGANPITIQPSGGATTFGGDVTVAGFVEDLYRRQGAGTPEGVITAPVGAVYHRYAGGAGTSFYVKESGAGNTGWVAK